jgi:hypothetical protein
MKALRLLALLVSMPAMDGCDDAVPRHCTTGVTLSAGGIVVDNVAADNCLTTDSIPGNTYTFLLPAPGVVRFDVEGKPAIDLKVSDLARAVASRPLVVERGITQRTIFAALPAGIFTVYMTMSDGRPADYFVVRGTIADLESCRNHNLGFPVYVVPQAILQGSLATDDCLDASSHYVDYAGVYMPANQQRTIVVNGNAGMAVAIHDHGTDVVAGQSSDVGGVVVRFTPSHAGFYTVTVSTKAPLATAAYSIRVD